MVGKLQNIGLVDDYSDDRRDSRSSSTDSGDYALASCYYNLRGVVFIDRKFSILGKGMMLSSGDSTDLM